MDPVIESTLPKPPSVPMKVPINLAMLKMAQGKLSQSNEEGEKDIGITPSRDQPCPASHLLSIHPGSSFTSQPVLPLSANKPPPTDEKTVKRIPKRPKFTKFPTDFDERITKTKAKLTQIRALKKIKSDGKTVSTGTSKANYIDPRIVVAWSKRYCVPLKKLFSQTLIKKYYWAAETDENFRF